MKKTTRLIASVLVLVICVGCFGLLCGCKASKLVGTWCFEDDEDYYVVFKSGGKGYMYDDDDPSDKVNFIKR